MQIEYIVEKYSRLIYKICYDMLSDSMDAQDITQEVYISLFKHFERYKELPENELKNVLCKIALNKCRDILRSKQKKLENMTDSNIISLENYMDKNDIEEEFLKNELDVCVKEAVDKIKQPYNKILKDYYINGMTLDEISKKYEVNKPTLKMQIYRAKKLLKEELEINGGANLL